MSTTTSGNFGTLERLVLSLESSPWDKLYRAIIGYCVMPAYVRWVGGSAKSWNIIAFFLVVLLALRVVPGVIRRVLPFSSDLKLVWADRRAMAKRYDSYQWRKLFSLGVGLITYIILSGKFYGPPLILGVFCVVLGGIGDLKWCRRNKSMTSKPAASASAA